MNTYKMQILSRLRKSVLDIDCKEREMRQILFDFYNIELKIALKSNNIETINVLLRFFCMSYL